MKKNFKQIALATFVMGMTHSAHAYKYVIYTDETTTTKSEEVAQMMKSTYPFNKFDVEIEIVRVSPEELDCGSSLGIDRLVTCKNSDSIQAQAARRGGDQAMIVKSMSKWGGSSSVGGGVPVITTGTSSRAMLHEYMHTLGLCDEYEYSASEAEIYCERERNTPNVAYITPESSYGSDPEAKALHGGSIPWNNDILVTTPITTARQLGTGAVDFKKQAPQNNTTMAMVLAEPTGLYRGQVCNKAKTPRYSWHPGGTSTVMNNVDAGLGAPLERIIERLLISKGVDKKLQFAENEPRVSDEKKNEERAGEVVVDSKPQTSINDTARGLFKSFFSWIKELFESIGRSLSR